MTADGRAQPTFGRCVFINCPFDAEYRPLFRALVFVVEACGFYVRCAQEIDDASETRAEKLLRIIRDSGYGIHDISRTELNPNQLPRFNMPYELGVFVGFKHAGQKRQARKVVLVLDRERYRYQQFLSDIAGHDIRCHEGRPDVLIREVRHWLRAQSKRSLPGAERLVGEFVRFQSNLPELLRELQLTEADLDSYADFHSLVFEWLVTYRNR